MSSGQHLPTVKFGDESITRLLIGHNPIKGTSHYSESLDEEMKTWYAVVPNIDATLRRAEQCGINTGQFGAEVMHQAMTRHAQRGGGLQWIATLYGNEKGDLGVGSELGIEEELAAILKVDPRPIGIQHFGEKTDRLYLEGKLDLVRERLKLIRDTGVMTGVCTHLPEVAIEIESQDWDIDFYQTSLYTVYSNTGERAIDREHEVFEDRDRDSMLDFIAGVSRPCIAFKILAANRKCRSEAAIEEAFRHAFARIKPIDVICVGMWQKHTDQVGFNTELVERILNPIDRD